MKYTYALALALVVNSLTLIFSQAYEIHVEVKGLENQDIILGHHRFKPNNMAVDDTIKLNHKGKGSFTGDQPLHGGMYLLYAPAFGYIDFLVDKNQKFTLKTDTADLLQHATAEGSLINEKFFAFQQFMVNKRHEADALNKKKEQAGEKEQKKIVEQLQHLNTEVADFKNKQIAENKDNFFGQFLNATNEVQVPDPPLDENGRVSDSTFQYRYYKAHYFDNLDAGDTRFFYTPLYENHLMQYIEKVAVQIPDSLIREVDMLIEKSRASDELFRYMLITLFNHYAKSKIMGMDALYIHIAEKYYIPEASWSNDKFIADLEKTVKRRKPLLIGKTAPNSELFVVPNQHFIDAQGDTTLMNNPHIGMFADIHDFNAPYKLLVFWEADCGHCKTIVPTLYKLYTESFKENQVEVIAVSTLGGIEGKKKWVDFVNKHEMYEWVNCWNPYSYTYKVDYDIQSTPQLFLLDKNNVIIAKQFGPKQVLDIVKMHKKQQHITNE